MKNEIVWIVMNLKTGESRPYNPASEMGKISAKKRLKGKTKAEISEIFKRIRYGKKKD